jgi:hypothetical protein
MIKIVRSIDFTRSRNSSQNGRFRSVIRSGAFLPVKAQNNQFNRCIERIRKSKRVKQVMPNIRGIEKGVVQVQHQKFLAFPRFIDWVDLDLAEL